MQAAGGGPCSDVGGSASLAVFGVLQEPLLKGKKLILTVGFNYLSTFKTIVSHAVSRRKFTILHPLLTRSPSEVLGLLTRERWGPVSKGVVGADGPNGGALGPPLPSFLAPPRCEGH